MTGALPNTAAVDREARCRSMLEVEPDRLELIHELGVLLQQQERFDEAVDHYRQALERRPKEVALYVGLAAVFHGAGNAAAAAEVCEMALRLDGSCAEAHNNHGAALKTLGRLDQAEQSLRRAVALRPGYLEALGNLGNVLKLRGDAAGAVDCYRQVLERQPDNATVCSNLGNALLALGHVEQAAECYDLALRQAPDLPAAHWNRALLWLQQGDFQRGWAEYEWGFAAGERPSREFQQPRWQGEPLAGKRLLVWAEQGFGDTLQFARYLPQLRQQGARVIFECQPELTALVRDSGVADTVIGGGDESPGDFDFQVPLLSLPGLLGARVDTIPAPGGYLLADPARVAAWSERLGPAQGLRIGVAWSGNPQQPVNRLRACPAEQMLAALSGLPGVTLYSLQKNVDLTDARLVDMTADLHDFAETAAFVTNLDLVVTVDTAVAHLAGALGRTVWTLLSQPADWRWMEGDANTPWYASMHLLRQPRPGQWDDLLGLVRRILTEVCAGEGGQPQAEDGGASVPAVREGRESFNQIHDHTYAARLSSARAVLGHLFPVLHPDSVLDVGCGLGAWLEVAKERGVNTVMGIDGDWIERQRVRLGEGEFRHQDLEQPLDLGRRFDLVVSLEVAEHLRAEAAEGFVDSLVRHGDVVLFSAAIPGQGGNGHVNEQLQHYWAALFAARGYVPVDMIRPRIWLDGNVFWWLQQNIVLYVREHALPQWPELHPYVVNRPEVLSIVHPQLYALKLQALGESGSA